MADIQSEILSKYDIDIARENIFKLYKIDRADISSQELETRIREARKRWETSVNGANEKNAQRDRARLEKADKYESILKNPQLRQKLFLYYSKSTGGGAAGSESSTEFAKEYFKLIATTKKVKKADVDFFFQYYQSERKNKKAILEMLSKELKISGLGKTDSYADEKEENSNKKNDNSSPFVVNLFQEATVLKIRRAIEKYEEIRKSNELCTCYPKLKEGLYEFLEVKNVDHAKDFVALMSEKGKEAYAVRQEKGAEYILLLDLFNILEEVGKYQDVADNISEFKLLLKYPDLTPYMYSFVEMKPGTMKGMIHIANHVCDYGFRDETDFILNYYQPLYGNFGISNSGIGSLIRKAEKKAKQNKVLNKIDERLGRNKKKSNGSIKTEIIHWLVYWPFFAVYFVFAAAKMVFTRLHMLKIPVFIVLFYFSNRLIPQFFDIENLLVLRKMVFKEQWLLFLEDFLGAGSESWFGIAILSLAAIISLLAIYVLPALFGSMFTAAFAEDFNKHFDWGGYERTFQNVFQNLRKKTREQYLAQRKSFIKNKIPLIVINIICLVMFVAIIHFTLIGIGKLVEISGYR